MEELEPQIVDTPVATIDKVMQDIYIACDVENNGLVPVSKLIEYITPFMQQNIPVLMDLKKLLDPSNVNPYIDSPTFFNIMGEWTSKFNEDNSDTLDEDNGFHNITPRDFNQIDDDNLPLHQSTPRSSFGHRLIKGYTESGILNMSNVSTSFVDANVTGTLDKTYFEDQINELSHKNKNCTDELFRVKTQLASTEEQMEQLQNDLKKVQQQLTTEQQLNEQFQKEQKEFDELKETSLATSKRMCNLDKQNSVIEKQIAQMKTNLKVLEDEKLSLEHKNKILRESDSEKMQVILKLQKEINTKEHQSFQMEKNNSLLLSQLKEANEIVVEHLRINQHLNLEKEALNKQLTIIKSKASQKQLTSSFQSESISEYSQSKKSANTNTTPFTSPIKTKKFTFYNFEAPIARKHVGTPRIDPASPFCKSSFTQDLKPNDASTPGYTKNHTSLLDITPPGFGGCILEPIKECASTQVIVTKYIQKDTKTDSETSFTKVNPENVARNFDKNISENLNLSSIDTYLKTPCLQTENLNSFNALNISENLQAPNIDIENTAISDCHYKCKSKLNATRKKSLTYTALMSAFGTPSNADSLNTPPPIYAIIHSDPRSTSHVDFSSRMSCSSFHTPTGDGSPNNSPKIVTENLLEISGNPANVSLNESSSEEDDYSKFNTSFGSPHQSLQAEISQAFNESNKLQVCSHQSQINFYEKTIIALQNEILKNQNTQIIEKESLPNIGAGDELKSTLDEKIDKLEREKATLLEINSKFNLEIIAVREELEQVRLDLSIEVADVHTGRSDINMKLISLQTINEEILKGMADNKKEMFCKDVQTDQDQTKVDFSCQTFIESEVKSAQTDSIPELTDDHLILKEEVIELRKDNKILNNLTRSLSVKTREFEENANKLIAANIQLDAVKSERDRLINNETHILECKNNLLTQKDRDSSLINTLQTTMITNEKLIEAQKVKEAVLSRKNEIYLKDIEMLKFEIQEKIENCNIEYRRLEGVHLLETDELNEKNSKLQLELNNYIDQLDVANTNLAEYEVLKNQFKTVSEGKEEIESSISDLVEKITTANNKLQYLEEENVQLKEEKCDLENKLEKVDQVISLESFNMETSSSSATSSERNSYNMTMAEFSSNYSLQFRVNELKEKVINIEAQIESQEIISEAASVIYEEKNFSEMEKAYEQLKEEFRKTEIFNNENIHKLKLFIDKRLDNLEKENIELKNELLLVETERNETIQKLSYENSEYTEKLEQIDLLNMGIQTLETQNAENKHLKNIISELEMNVADGEEREKNLHVENMNLLKKIDSLNKSQIKGKNYDRLKITQNKLELKIEHLEDQVDQRNEEITKLEAKIIELQLLETNSQLIKNNDLHLRRLDSVEIEIFGVVELVSHMERSTINIVAKWRSQLDKISRMEDILEAINNEDIIKEFSNPLDEALLKLKHVIMFTTNFLDVMGDVFKPTNNMLDSSNTCDITLQIPTQSSSINSAKNFTLKPSTIHDFRPISPDSPNLEIDFTIIPLSKRVLNQNTKNIGKLPSPDSIGTHFDQHYDATQVTFNNNSSINSFEEDSHNSFSEDETQFSYSSRKDACHLMDCSGDFSTNLQLFEDFESTFKYIRKDKLTDEELREKLNGLIFQFTTYNSKIRSSCKRQHAQISLAESKQKSQINQMISLLKITLYGENLTNAVMQMETISKASGHVKVLAEQLGALQGEQVMKKWIKLTINYISLLRSKIGNTKKLCKCTIITEQTNLGDTAVLKVDQTQLQLQRRTPRSRIGIRTQHFCLKLLFVGVVVCFVMAILFFGYIYSSLNSSLRRINGRNYAFRWANWDEIFAGFLHRELGNGPPPV